VPYVFALVEAVLFTIAGAAATLATAFSSSLRRFLALTWLMWLWGSIGFVATNLLLLAILFPILSSIGIASAPLHRVDVWDLVLTGLVLFGPVLFSSAGIILGCWYGWRVGWRHVAKSGV
jgi:hypothetical protein